MKVKFAKYSICICGFPMLDDSVPIGTEYDIDPDNKRPITFICGGCGKWIESVQCVYVHTRGKSHGGYLPEQIFEPVP